MKTLKLTVLVALCCLIANTALAGGSFKLPEYERLTLDNGLILLLMEQHEVPLIDVNVLVRGGALADGSHPGLARLTAESLMSGTEKLDRQALESQLDFVGARVNSGAGKEYNFLDANFAKKDAEMMLPLIRDLLLEPRFDDEEFARYQRRYIARLTQQKESPRRVIGSYFDKLVFEGHPYAAASFGDAESAGAVTTADLKAFHGRIYQPSGTVISVVGDFDTGRMKKALRRMFSDWGAADAAVTAPAAPAAPDRSRVLLVNKEDAGETTFYIGGKGVARSHPDFIGIQVINTILGGRFTSWLNDELRVNAGLTYGARSRFSMFSQGGSFAISTFTRTATTFEAIDLALETYGRLAEKGIDAETLASAKAYVKGQFPPRYETSGQLAGLLAEIEAYGLDKGFIDDFENRVDGLTSSEIDRIVREHFPAENLQFVAVGKASEIREGLARYGEVVEVDIEANGFDF